MTTVVRSRPTTYGIDVSRFQGDIDWQLVKDSGVVWSYIQISRSVTDLDAKFVEDFHEALIFAGRETFGRMLPAYLDFLLKLEGFSHALYVVGNQLTRKADAVDQRIFDARVDALTPSQRELVREIVSHLAARPAMERAMTDAVATWKELS